MSTPHKTFRVQVTRTRRIEELGYLNVKANTKQKAIEVASEMDDPEMEIIRDDITNCSHTVVGTVPT